MTLEDRPCQTHSVRSKVRYWMASLTCSGVMSSDAGEVGDGAADFQDAVVGAGAQVELGHGDADQFLAIRRLTSSAALIWRGPMRALQLVCLSERKRACWRSRAATMRARMASEGSSGRVLEMSRYSTAGTSMWRSMRSSKRAGDALAVTLDLDGTATAFAFQVAEVAAGAWVHGGDEHELARER